MTYRYKRYVFFRDGRDNHAMTEVVELSSTDLHMHIGSVGQEAFLRLLSNWNRVGARFAEINARNAVYVFAQEHSA